MVKKPKSLANAPFDAAAGLLDNALASSVKDSAQNIWLAGLGAFSKAQQEGGRVFESLIQEGVSLQRKTQSVAEETLGEVSSRVASVAKAGAAAAQASPAWDRLETIFEDRVAKALARLGVPAPGELNALVAQVEQLRAEVARLSGTSRGASRKTAAAAGPATAGKAGSKARAPSVAVKPVASPRGAARKAAGRSTP